jgi:predicted nucleic acid-binding protein
MKRTYVDGSVLLRAARGSWALSESAIEILCDVEREFVSSVLVRLEVMPRAKEGGELEFYETFFRHVAIWAPMDPYLLMTSVEEARNSGLGPMEAIHVVLAASTGCHELVTAEKRDAPIFATKRISIRGI